MEKEKNEYELPNYLTKLSGEMKANLAILIENGLCKVII
jgi:hypothetical protein